VRHHTVVGLIDRCETADLVVRGPDPDDRRQVRVTLTEKGENILDRLSLRNLAELQTMRAAFDIPMLVSPPEGTKESTAE
jgi:DNA-binding MarR family transcriptional regulator